MLSVLSDDCIQMLGDSSLQPSRAETKPYIQLHIPTKPYNHIKELEHKTPVSKQRTRKKRL